MNLSTILAHAISDISNDLKETLPNTPRFSHLQFRFNELTRIQAEGVRIVGTSGNNEIASTISAVNTTNVDIKPIV